MRISIGTRIALHVALGIAAGLGFGLALLAFDVGGLGGLVRASGDGWTVVIVLAGSVFAFAPVCLCTGIGLLAGPERGPPAAPVRPRPLPVPAQIPTR